jgi:two-component system sensor histidine kinase KdpD
MTRSASAARWLIWLGVLVLMTVALVAMRAETEQTYVPLTYLLLVLGGSVGGGRRLGFTLACVSFVIIDYFLQTPYDSISFGKSVDFVTLVAFFATAAVASQLLERARVERDAAVRHAEEVLALSRLGSESLSAARADDAVAAVASVIRIELGAEECTIVPGSAPPGIEARADPREVALPLDAHNRVVGTLVLRFALPVAFRPGQQAFLEALSYYAALALERARLAEEAEHIAALREADRMKDFVLASVSHDLRTPLTTIKALAQEERRTGIMRGAEIEEQADRLTRMVADLLDLSRLRSGGFAFAPELNAAEDVIGAAIRQCEGIADDRRITVALDGVSPALYGTFDYLQTLRILVNLLENGVRHGPVAEVVELSVRRDADTLIFAVADRGPGIASEERERVFEAFYRPEGSLPDRGRAGLGLAIARSLAEGQGGSLRYRSRAGGGSVFEVRLPAADVDEEAIRET